MKLVVGLGNPGAKYAATRHNVGYRVVDLLARKWRIDLSREKFHGWFGDGSIGGEQVALLKPLTFMNRSGRAVAAAVRFYRLQQEELLVVGDDLALPLGRIRLRARGSAGGHNGLQDVIDQVGSTEFARLRLGIDQPLGDPVAYVLAPFVADEREVVEEMVETAADAVECWIESGPLETMNRFNAQANQD